jgi:hypothetical protein
VIGISRVVKAARAEKEEKSGVKLPIFYTF